MKVVLGNPVLRSVLAAAERVGLPGWYVGAGAVAQTVWTDLHGFDAAYGIGDYDLVYFDPADLRAETDAEVARLVAAEAGLPVGALDVKNQARMHLWYEERFGVALAPYRSTEEAIATWVTTATSIGVRTEDGELVVCAPYGVEDLFAMRVRPNKVLVTEEVYVAKAQRWAALWPRLQVEAW